ncbi:MAG: NUDIX domain-containing protein [Thaumarchaeota archaeon]|nr:NUDIX domain-containing protein [Nitrososphaerota archaeon]
MEERSAGAVVFRHPASDRRVYLLLQNASRWDFPKGNVEKGESELQTVLREVGEETGLKDISVVPGFRRVVEYFYRREGKNVHKEVVYLLARTEEAGVKISFEHQGYGWFPYEQARQKASYDNSRMTLEEAEHFLQARIVENAQN